jgi:DNA primase
MGNEWVDFGAVKAAVGLAEVLRLYEVEGLRAHRPGQLQGRCPLHRGHRRDAFQVSLTKNVFHCFACQRHGNVLDFVAAMERCSVREAALRLVHRFSLSSTLPAMEMVGLDGEKDNWLGKNEAANRPLGFSLRGIDGFHPYLRDRGISPETAVQFGVGFYPGPGLMSGRVVIPIHDACGKLVAYAGRSLHRTPPKYRLPAGFRKSEVLFNFHRAARLEQQTVIVVEGYFDCLQVHQAGFPCVVALMGTALCEMPEKLVVKRFRRLILMLDGDESGRKATQRIAGRLAESCSVRLVALPVDQQPDQLNGKEIRALLTQAGVEGLR